ncbi:hypothetical protein GCM10010339_85050 [Streptomyces alanosinicus]|uniref:Uncharacterized protein n=1 Tax=Streptomyces alanosinicus TaxID=68171 RepID=A0A919D853_9ACTN|nr:hypothetical protein GCM10010339_85050 [Streptomyces alanosinicus]
MLYVTLLGDGRPRLSASLAARQTLRACGAYRLVAGCELVAAVRALRQCDLSPDPQGPDSRPLGRTDGI